MGTNTPTPFPHHSQVKEVEAQYSSMMRQLEAQLDAALAGQAAAGAAVGAGAAASDTHGGASAAEAPAAAPAGPDPAIDTCSAAEKALQLLERLMQVCARVRMHLSMWATASAVQLMWRMLHQLRQHQ